MNNEGPTAEIENIDYNSLNVNDLFALKMFIEKGKRMNIFIHHENNIATILHKKLDNILNDIIKKNKPSS